MLQLDAENPGQINPQALLVLPTMPTGEYNTRKGFAKGRSALFSILISHPGEKPWFLTEKSECGPDAPQTEITGNQSAADGATAASAA